MAKENAATAQPFLSDLFQAGLYKRNQGRVVRQVTWASVFVCFLLASYRLYIYYNVTSELPWVVYGIPLLVLAGGFWLSFRLVNYARFADFLIAVEAEMNKVTWPSRTELVRSSLVVIFVIFFLAFLLFGYDLLWEFVFKLIGVIRR